MSEDIDNSFTFEEKDLFNYICNYFPNTFYIRKNGRNNCYVYNEVQFFDVTDQQVNNEYNLSIGCVEVKVIGSSKREEIVTNDDKPKTRVTTYLKKTFQIHIWSVNKSNIEVLHIAEPVRMAIMAYKDQLNTDENIQMNYTKLDDTNKPLNDCFFTTELITKDVYTYDIDTFDDAVIEDIIPITD